MKGVDLDKVLWLLLDHHARATTKHEAWLKAAFLKFDDDAPGLQEIEFVRLCRWALGPSFDDLSSLDVHNLFRQIGDLADQAGTGGDDDAEAQRRRRGAGQGSAAQASGSGKCRSRYFASDASPAIDPARVPTAAASLSSKQRLTASSCASFGEGSLDGRL